MSGLPWLPCNMNPTLFYTVLEFRETQSREHGAVSLLEWRLESMLQMFKSILEKTSSHHGDPASVQKWKPPSPLCP